MCTVRDKVRDRYVVTFLSVLSLSKRREYLECMVVPYVYYFFVSIHSLCIDKSTYILTIFLRPVQPSPLTDPPVSTIPDLRLSMTETPCDLR